MTDNSHEVDGQRVTPVAEQHVGTVLPGGRGTELHGVPFSGEPRLVEAWEEGDPVEVPTEPPAPEPVPVRVVSESTRELRRFRTFRAFAPLNIPAEVVGQSDRRSKAKVQNMGTETVWVGDTPGTANAMHGFPLAVGAAFETTAETPIYASCATGTDSQPLAVFTEFATETK